MALIQTKGFEVLNEGEKADFDKLIKEYSRKIERQFKNIHSFIIPLKKYKEDGRVKFSINARVMGPSRVF